MRSNMVNEQQLATYVNETRPRFEDLLGQMVTVPSINTMRHLSAQRHVPQMIDAWFLQDLLDGERVAGPQQYGYGQRDNHRDDPEQLFGEMSHGVDHDSRASWRGSHDHAGCGRLLRQVADKTPGTFTP